MMKSNTVNRDFPQQNELDRIQGRLNETLSALRESNARAHESLIRLFGPIPVRDQFDSETSKPLGALAETHAAIEAILFEVGINRDAVEAMSKL